MYKHYITKKILLITEIFQQYGINYAYFSAETLLINRKQYFLLNSNV